MGRLARPRWSALLAALVLLGRTAAADEPAARRFTMVTASCVEERVDSERFLAILRVEVEALGVTRIVVRGASEPVEAARENTLVLGCPAEPAESVSVRHVDADLTVPLADVAAQARPRVLALAVAEQLALWLRAAPEAADPPPADSATTTPAIPAVPAPSPPIDSAHRLELETTPATHARWGVSARLDGRLGSREGSQLGGVSLFASRWGERLSVHAGATFLAGRGTSELARLLTAHGRVGFEGPRWGRARFALEVGVEIGRIWIEDVPQWGSELFYAGSGDLVTRFELSADWQLALSLGYRRLKRTTATEEDAAALGLALSRRL